MPFVLHDTVVAVAGKAGASQVSWSSSAPSTGLTASHNLTHATGVTGDGGGVKVAPLGPMIHSASSAAFIRWGGGGLLCDTTREWLLVVGGG